MRNCASGACTATGFRGIAQSIHAGTTKATLHGVVFDILVGSEHCVGLAAVGGATAIAAGGFREGCEKAIFLLRTVEPML
jgi:hypothetical protein